jgi:hypothetical protein
MHFSAFAEQTKKNCTNGRPHRRDIEDLTRTSRKDTDLSEIENDFFPSNNEMNAAARGTVAGTVSVPRTDIHIPVHHHLTRNLTDPAHW